MEKHLELFVNSLDFHEYLWMQIAAEVAAPLSQTKKVTMVSTGKGEVGAAKLTGEVLDVVEKMPLLVQNMTGVDISKVRVSN